MSDKPRLSHNYGTIDKEYAMFLATPHLKKMVRCTW